MGPGPTNIDRRIKSALSREPLSHLDPDFFSILDNISSSLRRVFKTNNKVTFAVSGTGSSGMEMAMTNLIEPGDEVLVLKNGEFGNRMENLAQRLKAKVSVMSTKWGESFEQSLVIEKIKSMPNLKLVSVVHAETSTGVLQEIDLIGKYLKSTDIIFLVDAVTSLTGVNLEPIHKKDRPKEVKHATCSADKARSLLNYKTTVSLDDGIKKTYEYIKKRGTRPFDYNINIEINNDLTPTTWKNKEI